MNTQASTQEFSVSLLIDNISEAKLISDALRELGIYAHFYEDLDEFWVSANTSSPDLAIIDVKKMSQKNLLFKNHPKVKNRQLNFAFFYKESTRPLLNSIRSLSYSGLIALELDLVSQLRSLLLQVERQSQLENENNILRDRVQRLQKRSNKILKDVEVSYNFEGQFQLLQELITRFGSLKQEDSFITRAIDLFSKWDDCTQFGVYELNDTHQKLVAPRIVRKGYKQLPDLWPSQQRQDGIANFAQEMAMEVAYDTFDTNLKMIQVHSTHNEPDIIIIGEFVEQNLIDFQWEMLELFLTGQYRAQVLNRVKGPVRNERHINIWECFSLLDDISFHQSKPLHKVAGLNFNPLLNIIKGKHGNRFYWKSFYSDFISQLSQNLSGNYKISEFGVQDFLVFIDQKYLESDFSKLRSFVADFPYWRYFEDSAIIMNSNMAPELKVIAPSSVNVIRNIQREVVMAKDIHTKDIGSTESESRLRSRPFPTQEM